MKDGSHVSHEIFSGFLFGRLPLLPKGEEMPGFSVWTPIKNKTGTAYLKLEETGKDQVAVVIVDARGHRKPSPYIFTFNTDGTVLRHCSVNHRSGFQLLCESGKVKFVEEG